MVTVLTGFMGSGKSSVGRALSELLHSPFIDLDDYISAKAGKTIPEIFDTAGEDGFRAIESLALKDLLEGAAPERDLVLSLGGGTVIREENAALIVRGCRCIFLRASAVTLRSRLEGETENRPMLRTGRFEELLAARTPVYERVADRIIDTDGLTPQEIAYVIAQDNQSHPI